MTDHDDAATRRDYSETLFLPKTDYPMRAGLPKKEPEIVKKWDEMGLYKRLREASAGRDRYILHDGPPYANGHLHIGHALNKILKDLVTRSKQMAGFDSNYVPGWDCHGLPIEWKIEEQYRAKGKDKDAVPVNEFRKECRDFAEHWIKVQTEEFRRLGVEGDFETPYTTMSFDAEATIASELMKFAMSGQLYRGSKPVMWSVVERTALAEAEVEYREYESDQVWVKFPITKGPADTEAASIVIWTTTPWTIPGNRAISYSSKISYGLYKVVSAENDYGPQPGELFIIAKSLQETCAGQAKIELVLESDLSSKELAAITCAHPLRGLGYDFDVPLLDGDHVTDDAGTGFVHTAPGHGREDFEIWMENARDLRERGIDVSIPFTVDDGGFFTEQAPGLTGARVIDDKGKKGDANKRVIEALIETDMLFARGRLKHEYPHSWRSKKPVIFRNTPQWFVYMDEPINNPSGARQAQRASADQAAPAQASEQSERSAVSEVEPDTLRTRALKAIDETRFVPRSGQNRLRGMIENRPDWVLSRQRAWGVPIAVFYNDNTGEVLKDEDVNARIVAAFEEEGADAWFADDAKARFLGNRADADDWTQVTDILDVWFDSGSTHAFVMEKRADLAVTRPHQGGTDKVLYLEGSDQHRGWFHSSLLESCGTRGVAPYDDLLTHGFILDEKGTEKMSKSKGNALSPQDVMKQFGADILRLWVVSSDYWTDIRFGPEIVNANADSYRKLRNTLRWLLGNLHHYDRNADRLPAFEMPELERYILHRLTELDVIVRRGYEDFDFKRVFTALFNFATVDLSAFYFDIRKDALYCEAPSSLKRKACLTVLDHVFDALVTWLAPMIPFTAEETWQARHPDSNHSVHLEVFPEITDRWRDDALAARWKTIRMVRRVVTGALEIERREKRIGSSLEAAPEIWIADHDLKDAVADVDWAEIAIASQAQVFEGEAPEDAFHLEDVHGVGVVPGRAKGQKCARSWRILPEVGTDPDYPDLSLRDAAAMREIEGRA